MNRKAYLKFYRREGKLVLYTVCFQDSLINETDKFFNRFKDDPDYREDVQIIVRAIQILGKRGVEDNNLRPEESANAIPLGKSNLRLYCVRGQKYCLILGGGGVKSSQKVSGSPDLLPHFESIIQIESAFREAVYEGSITWNDDDTLSGDLTLELIS